MRRGKNSKKNKAFKQFEQNCLDRKEINLNPLLSIIINLIPMFLIILNMRMIVGTEQNHIPSAQYDAGLKQESKELVDVEIDIYSKSTHVVLKDYKGQTLAKKSFATQKLEKEKHSIVEFLTQHYKDNYGHVTINPKGTLVTFNEISQAIDIGNAKIDEKRLFKNFSIGNIL